MINSVECNVVQGVRSTISLFVWGLCHHVSYSSILGQCIAVQELSSAELSDLAYTADSSVRLHSNWPVKSFEINLPTLVRTKYGQEPKSGNWCLVTLRLQSFLENVHAYLEVSPPNTVGLSSE